MNERDDIPEEIVEEECDCYGCATMRHRCLND